MKGKKSKMRNLKVLIKVTFMYVSFSVLCLVAVLWLQMVVGTEKNIGAQTEVQNERERQIEEQQTDEIQAEQHTVEKIGTDILQQPETESIQMVHDNLKEDMPMNQCLNISEEEFISQFENFKYDETGVLRRNRKLFWDLAIKYEMNQFLVPAIIALESGWGTSPAAIQLNNYTSQMDEKGNLICYSSEADCIADTFRNLSENYMQEGGMYYDDETVDNKVTLSNINTHYCIPTLNADGTYNEKGWAKAVYECMLDLTNSKNKQ